jgi:hypothetical protein
MSFDRDKVLELMGGEQKFDDAMDETFTEKIGDEGQLLFVPPDRGFNEFSDEDVDSNSKALLPGMEREMFSEERTKIKTMLESIFESLRDPSTPSEIRLNPHCEISIDDEDIDAILESYLDGLED